MNISKHPQIKTYERKAAAFILTVTLSTLGYAATKSLANLKLEKARAAHPKMEVISYHQKEQLEGQVQVLYSNPPDKNLHTMLINSKTGDIISDQLYKEKRKAPILTLEELIKKLQEKHPMKKVNKAVLNNNGTRTIHYVDKYNQQKTIIANAATGAVIENKSTRHRSAS